jgi:hypothetical protein
MRGGCLRFQAQYLRRIRLPLWQDVPPDTQRSLCLISDAADAKVIQRAVAEAYGLTEHETQYLTD